MTTLKELQKDIHATAKEKGWHDVDRAALEFHALIVSEVAEATEEVRSDAPKLYYTKDKPDKPEGEAAEIADVIIRCLDYADLMGWDMEDIIKQKVSYNKKRSYRHGGKVK